MKKKLLIAFSIVTCLAIAFFPKQSIHGSTSGGPAGYTGSPFDFSGRTCGSGGGCHSSGTTNQNGIITSDIPACGYTPGQTYNITVTATSAGRTKFGFSLSAQKTSDGVTAGTLIAGAGSQLNGSNRYITHTSAGTAATGSGTRVWNFQWTAPVAGTGSVSLYAAVNCTNSGGNSSGDIIFNSSIAIQEGGIPAAPVISAVGSTNICAGQSVTLNSNTATGISWSTGANTQSINVNTTGIFTATATNSCGSATSNSINVFVTSLPAAPVVTAGANGFQFCEGQSTTLIASSVLPVVWTPGNFTTNQINVNTGGIYTASATNNCGTTTSLPVAVIEDPLPVIPNVTASGSASFCFGDSVILSTDAEFSYTWSNDITQPNITVLSSGEYFVSSVNECGISYSDTIIVSADLIPATPEITFNGDGFLQSSISAPFYNWFINGNPINSNDSAIVPSQQGDYTLILASNSGCFSDTSAAFNYNATSVSSYIKSNNNIYPNPVQQNQWITFSNNIPQNSEITIFDLQGRTVFKSIMSQQTMQICLLPGTYIIANKYMYSKLIVQ